MEPTDVIYVAQDKTLVTELNSDIMSKIARGEEFYRRLEEPIVGDTVYITTDVRDLPVVTIIQLIFQHKLYY